CRENHRRRHCVQPTATLRVVSFVSYHPTRSCVQFLLRPKRDPPNSQEPTAARGRSTRDRRLRVQMRWFGGGFRIITALSRRSGFATFFSTAASPDKEIVAEKVLKEFHPTIENAAASSVKDYAAYIDKMCKIGNLFTVRQMLQALQERNISVPPNVYIVLLAEASQKNDIDLSCQAFKKLLLSCKSPTAASCLSFGQAFTKADGCIELLRFIEEVSEITCSSTSFVNKIIFALAKSGQKDKALVIFDYLKSRNCSLDLVTYNIVLDILGRTGRVDEMFDVFATMKEAGFVPDTVSYNSVLNGLRKAGRTDMCIVYFKEMSENGIEPDLLTYTALIENFGRSGNAEESLKCFSEMKLKGILPSIYIYRSLINNLNKSGKVELAKELLEEMNLSSTRLAGPEDFKHKRRRRNRLTEGPEVRYPGDITVIATYTLISGTTMRLDMEGVPKDKPTIINLAQHTYWNLAGHNSGDVLNHSIQIWGNHVTPVDQNTVPTGEIMPVKGIRLILPLRAE
ncbi:hypothetical protein S245_071216, partial [Arachis hypogaea]